jgi:hypothetical protein
MYGNNIVVHQIHNKVWMPIDLACNLSAIKLAHKVVNAEVWLPMYYGVGRLVQDALVAEVWDERG